MKIAEQNPSYVHGSNELLEHLIASQELAVAVQELRDTRATLWAYNDSPGTEFSAEKGDALWAAAKDKVRAAQARVNAAHVSYTDPFRRKPQNQEA